MSIHRCEWRRIMFYLSELQPGEPFSVSVQCRTQFRHKEVKITMDHREIVSGAQDKGGIQSTFPCLFHTTCRSHSDSLSKDRRERRCDPFLAFGEKSDVGPRRVLNGFSCARPRTISSSLVLGESKRRQRSLVPLIASQIQSLDHRQCTCTSCRSVATT